MNGKELFSLSERKITWLGSAEKLRWYLRKNNPLLTRFIAYEKYGFEVPGGPVYVAAGAVTLGQIWIDLWPGSGIFRGEEVYRSARWGWLM